MIFSIMAPNDSHGITRAPGRVTKLNQLAWDYEEQDMWDPCLHGRREAQQMGRDEAVRWDAVRCGAGNAFPAPLSCTFVRFFFVT